MPIYEYRCKFCGTLIEANRTIEQRNNPISGSDDDVLDAPGDGYCIHIFNRAIATPTNTPFETLRDAGVFERLPGRYDYRGK